MKEPMATIQITNSEAEPNVWRWNIRRGSETLLSGGKATTEPNTYPDPKGAADGAIRAYIKMTQTPYRED